MDSTILKPLEVRRYAPQISLPSVGLEGQEKIKKSRILVIGSGGKGTIVMQNLVSAGIGVLGISDNYLIEEDFLSRQSFFGDTDIGKQKAIASRQKLSKINQLVDIELYNICLSNSNIESICKKYDIIVDATDNFPAHYMISDSAIRLNKPLVYGCTFESQGHISVFNYNNGPSFRCLYPDPSARAEKPDLTGMTSQSVLSHFTGTFMAHEVLKIILNLDSVLSGKLLIFSLPNYKIEYKQIKKVPQNFMDYAKSQNH